MKRASKNISGDYQYLALKKKILFQRQWHKNQLNLIKELNFLQKDDGVLDAGCGSGNVVLEFAPRVKSIIGLDNNKQCVLFLNKKIKEETLSNAKAQFGDLLQLNFKNKKFNKIILTEVVEHFIIKDCQIILNNLFRLCKTDGKILITTPNYQSLWPMLEWFLDTFNLVPHLQGTQHLNRFTAESLQRLVTNSGFKITKVGTWNSFTPFLAFISQSLADKLFKIEIYLPFGNLLYLEAQRTN